MADGDYERGRGREIGAIAAELKRLAAARTQVFVLNGWAASPQAWNLCRFRRTRLFSYVEQLDGLPEKALAATERAVLVGWSMGGCSALRLAARFPEKIAGLVLVAATPRMMEEKETGWRGMSPRRLEALRYGLMMTRGEGFFGVPEGKPNPYLADESANLERGLKYLLETDVRAELAEAWCLVPGATHKGSRESTAPSTKHQALGTKIFVFQSEHDGIVRPENAAWLKTIFPQASVTMVPGTEHALPIFIPEMIDDAIDACLAVAQKG